MLLRISGNALHANEINLVNDISSLSEAISQKLQKVDSSTLIQHGKNVNRLPYHSKVYLEEWFVANSSHPYLRSSEARTISEKTGLTLIQVQNWMSNRRRKSKKHCIEPLLSHLLDWSQFSFYTSLKHLLLIRVTSCLQHILFSFLLFFSSTAAAYSRYFEMLSKRCSLSWSYPSQFLWNNYGSVGDVLL